MTTSSWKFGKRRIDGVAKTLTFERELFRAWKHVGEIHILDEDKWIETRNEWVFGYTSTHGWAASNRKRAWQFRDANVLERFAEFMAKAEWQVTPA